MHSSTYKKSGAPDRRSLTQQKCRLFTCVTPHTKRKGLPIDGPLLSKNLGFLHAWHRIQKARAPDRQYLTQQKLIFFTRVAPRIKSKGAPNQHFTHLLLLSAVLRRVQKARGLPINAPHIFYYFQHALRRVKKARGFIGMCC
jgi:hypothetical protein